MGVGPLHTICTLAAIVFTIGVAGIILNHKNIIIILMSVELILFVGQHQPRRLFGLFGRSDGAGFRALHPDGGGGGDGDRPSDPGRLLPQSRLDRG